MAGKILLPFGRALVASGALVLSPDDAALDADLVPDAVTEPTRSHERHESGLPAVETITQARSAWLQRERILSVDEHVGRARDFLLLARQHDHEAYQVEESATALGLTRRHLHRKSLDWFGLLPSVVIDLSRMVSVYGEIQNSYRSLAAIAREHHFPNLPKLDRFSIRFTGMCPSAIRRILRPTQTAGD